MVRSFMKRIPSIFIMLACINWAQQESNTSKEKPQVNFKGTLVDSSGNIFSVENITISGLYKNIPLYALPTEPTSKPEGNTTLVDLSDIEEISSPYGAHKETFNNRPYYKINVKLKNGTPDDYLVEASRKIICDRNLNGGAVEKLLTFDALRKLTLGNAEPRADSATGDTAKRPLGTHEHECEQAGKVLQELTQEVEKIPEPHKNKLSRLLDAAKNWVGGICSTATSKK
jgi:hypothetical protein